jgi:hypothetical protein
MTIVAIGGGHSLEAGAAASFARILAIRPGVLAKVNSAYRSNTEQAALRKLWETYQAGGPWAAYAMLPGTSKHNTGTALDIDSSPWNPEHQWMVDNGRPHGWRRTVKAEPWHFEYFQPEDTHQEDDMATPAELWGYKNPAAGSSSPDALQRLANAEAAAKANGAKIDALTRAVAALKVTGAPIDYAALAKAVNDDAAKRMQA